MNHGTGGFTITWPIGGGAIGAARHMSPDGSRRPSRLDISSTVHYVHYVVLRPHTGITVSRAPAPALSALSRRFRGWIASPAPLRVHRPTRASGDGAEGVERIEGARRRR